MDINQIIEKLSNPEKLIDPREINLLQSHLNGFISDAEEECWEKQLLASNKLAELNISLSAAKADVQWRISPEYVQWKQLERSVKKLKRYRSDLRDRFQILTNTKRY